MATPVAETAAIFGEQRLRDLVAQSNVRDASLVMAPTTMGAARLTRYSFSRSMLRRAVADGWQTARTHFEVDADGAGETIYLVDTGNGLFSFVAFTTILDESLHTDRVVANAWEITGALVEGDLSTNAELLALLRVEVPKQEAARLPTSVAVLTRGNRSVRFFDYLVETLAAGDQPDADQVADAGYIMRSTAFYGNGKFGMTSFAGLEPGGPISAPYRAQMVAAWCYRELAYDIVEHCARLRGGDRAVPFNDEWSRFFGLGNATGLGLVPYAFKHPRVIDSWVGIREVALSAARTCEASEARVAIIKKWLDKTVAHFSNGADTDCTPFLSPFNVAEVARRLAVELHALVDSPETSEAEVFDAWYSWAEADGPETCELCVSMLLELGPTLDHDLDNEVDQLLVVDETVSIDETMLATTATELLDSRFGWIDQLTTSVAEGDDFWWVISTSNEEPRRVRRCDLEADQRDVSIDVVRRMQALRSALMDAPLRATLGEVLASHPEHTMAAKRLIESDRPFGEPRDNPCAPEYLPLQLQRFQLAMYGMDNFKPKSTDWLRVTLFQGAPRLAEVNGQATRIDDDWVLPIRPRSTT